MLHSLFVSLTMAIACLSCGDDGSPAGSTGGDSTTDGSAGPTSAGPTTVDPDGSTGGSATDGSGASSTGADTCGNGVIDASEPCDGDDLGGMTCMDLDRGFTGGTLSCDPGCELDTAACFTCGNGTCEGFAGEAAAGCSEDCGQLSPTWGVVFDGTGGVFANDVAVDPTGNVFVVGSVFGTVDFGDGDVAAASTDVFVAKLDPDGALAWANLYGDASDQLAFAAAADSAGNVFVAGTFRGNLDFGGPTLSGGSMFDDIFVAKLDPDGTHLASDRFGTAGAADEATGLAVDSSDAPILVGRFQTSIDFGSFVFDATGGPGDYDAFVTLFSSDLVVTDAAAYGDGADQRLAAVAIGPDDGFVMAGSSAGAIDFGAGVLPNAAGERTVLAGFDVGGNHAFSHLFTGDGPSGARSVAVAASGDVIVAGAYTGSIDFGDGAIMSGGAGNDDAFLARFDADGNLVAGEGYGDGSLQRATDVAVDSLDRTVFTGTKVGAMTIGNTVLPPFGGSDAFVAKLTPIGAVYWAGVFGDADNQTGAALAVDSADDTIWAANVSGNLDLGVGSSCTGCTNAVLVAKLGN